MFYDRGMKNDMEVLNINCSSCPWNGLFKNYQVIQIYFYLSY